MMPTMAIQPNMRIWTLAVLSLAFIGRGHSLCSSDEADNPDYPYRYYSWWTLYDTVVGKLPTLENRTTEECTPIHIVLIGRHASRFPGETHAPFLQGLEELSRNLNTTEKAKLCPEDMEKIQKWTNWYNPENKSDVAPTGKKEMRGIARRFSELLPEILSDAGSKADKFRFLATQSVRTSQSAEAFAQELFKDNPSARPEIEAVEDSIIHPYCEKFWAEVERNETADKERPAFDAGEYMTKVVEDFADNLGLPRGQYDLNYVYEAIEYGCTYEEWSTGIRSPWCLAFSTDDIKAYEYGEDIRAYLTDSYGHEINYQQVCELRYFILSALKNASMEASPSRLGHFGFSHGPPMLRLFTSMKLIKDEGILKADDYKANANRTFRTSHLIPGSGNAAFVLYKCGETDDMKIQIFLNEEELKMPLDDPNAGRLWDLDAALDYYDFHDGMCDFGAICNVEAEESGDSFTEEPPATYSESTTDAATEFTRAWSNLLFTFTAVIVLFLA